MANAAITFSRHWHHLSAREQVLGPLSVRIATLLMGKHKPRGIYNQANDQIGDYVVVTDAERIVVTGRKAEQKVYYRHSMYPGGLKMETFKERLEKKPEEIIRAAVSGMLPKNKLRDRRLERLKIFAGDHNPYEQNISRRYDIPPVGADVGLNVARQTLAVGQEAGEASAETRTHSVPPEVFRSLLAKGKRAKGEKSS